MKHKFNRDMFMYFRFGGKRIIDYCDASYNILHFL